MKKKYVTPQMATHGSVKSITQAFGPTPAPDTIFAGASNMSDQNGSAPGAANATGSVDGIVTPYP